MAVTRPHFRRLAAALVHVYTGTGGILALFAIRAIDASAFRQAFLLIFVATMIDYSDGMLARWADVRRMIPTVDGDKLDTAIDFSVNVIVPLYLLLRANCLPRPYWIWCSLALLSSLYRFANTNPHRGVGFFLGLPPIFVIPAFYVFFDSRLGPLLILMYSVLCFVPVGYIHVTLFPRLKLFTGGIVMLWWFAYLAFTQEWMAWSGAAAAVSVAPLVTYVAVSISVWVAFRRGSPAANERTR